MYTEKAVRYYEKGRLFYQQNKLLEAERAYKRAIKINSDFVEAYNNLGNVFLDRGRLKEAANSFRKALELLPDHAMLQANLGNVLQLQDKNDEALDWLRKAISSDPNYAPAYLNLGNALKKIDRLSEAVDSYQQAIKLEPNLFETYVNLGNVQKEQGKLEQAIASYNRAIQIKPDFAMAYHFRGSVQEELLQLQNAIDSHEKALQLNPDYAEAHSNRNCLLNYSSELAQIEIFNKHIEFEKQFGGLNRAKNKRVFPGNGNSRRLRVGYFSPDFRMHSVSYFFEPLIRFHDRQFIEVFCYYNNTKIDDTTLRLMKEVEHWRPIACMNDQHLVDLIKKDKIDILVDLAGHTAGNRLTVFARKPSPLQFTWLGYPNTTGLNAIDFRFTDEVADPIGEADKLHSETLVRLPNGFLCYQGDNSAKLSGDPPCLRNGYVTFASFNNLSKVTHQVVKVWARIVASVPSARLVLKSAQFSNAGTKARYFELFSKEGISADRLELYARLPCKADHLEFYERVDIGLDPFPYNGTTTTCEALWMGVPVISLSGDRHAGRVGTSILTHAGLEEFIATGVDEYVDKAVRWADKPDELALLRGGLRHKLRNSDLCNAAAFARSVESAYWEVWGQYLKGVDNN